MRFLIAAALVLSCSLCLAEDLPEDTKEIKSLTAEQAAELVAKFDGHLSLDGLTSSDKDVLKILKRSPVLCCQKSTAAKKTKPSAFASEIQK